MSRYPQIHYYLLYISLRISNQNYCSEFVTPVLDEIEDVTSAAGKSVEVVLKGKSIALRTPKERKLKTHLVERKQCLIEPRPIPDRETLDDGVASSFVRSET